MRLLGAVGADDGDPAFSPDGRRIVFTVARGGTTDLYVRPLAGGAARLVVRNASEPAWSSRNRLAYVRGAKIYTARPDGTRRRLVTAGVSPDWSPSGRRLVFIRLSPGNAFGERVGAIWVADRRGRGQRRVRGGRRARSPVWSPDGRAIAWVRVDAGVLARRLGSRRPAREVAPEQVSGESGSVFSFDPAWRPR